MNDYENPYLARDRRREHHKKVLGNEQKGTQTNKEKKKQDKARNGNKPTGHEDDNERDTFGQYYHENLVNGKRRDD